MELRRPGGQSRLEKKIVDPGSSMETAPEEIGVLSSMTMQRRDLDEELVHQPVSDPDLLVRREKEKAKTRVSPNQENPRRAPNLREAGRTADRILQEEDQIRKLRLRDIRSQEAHRPAVRRTHFHVNFTYKESARRETSATDITHQCVGSSKLDAAMQAKPVNGSTRRRQCQPPHEANRSRKLQWMRRNLRLKQSRKPKQRRSQRRREQLTWLMEH